MLQAKRRNRTCDEQASGRGTVRGQAVRKKPCRRRIRGCETSHRLLSCETRKMARLKKSYPLKAARKSARLGPKQGCVEGSGRRRRFGWTGTVDIWAIMVGELVGPQCGLAHSRLYQAQEAMERKRDPFICETETVGSNGSTTHVARDPRPACPGVGRGERAVEEGWRRFHALTQS
jgi:hypothetical protein